MCFFGGLLEEKKNGAFCTEYAKPPGWRKVGFGTSVGPIMEAPGMAGDCKSNSSRIPFSG